VVSAIIMAGGYGSRLYPLSTPEYPKQFLFFSNRESFFQKSLKRAAKLSDRIIIAANIAHKQIVEKQIENYKNVIVCYENEPDGTYKPVRKIVLSGDLDEVYLLLQSDHYYQEESTYIEAIKKSIKSCIHGKMIVHGIESNGYQAGFGYIHRAYGNLNQVKFIEKPDLNQYQKISKDHQLFLHLGNTIFHGSTFLREAEKHELSLNWDEKTMDTAILANSKNLQLNLLNAGWTDIGTWKNLINVLPKDLDENFASSGINLVNCRGCIAIDSANNSYPDSPLIIKSQKNKIFIVRNSKITSVLDREEC